MIEGGDAKKIIGPLPDFVPPKVPPTCDAYRVRDVSGGLMDTEQCGKIATVRYRHPNDSPKCTRSGYRCPEHAEWLSARCTVEPVL